MSEPAPRLATYEDLLGLSEDVRAEILEGQIITAPSPLPKHAKTQGALRRFLGGPFDDDDGFGGPGGWWIFVEVDVQLERHQVVRPDVAGWRRSRLPQPDEIRPIDVTPDWVCEVLSPSTEARDRGVKRDLYARHGVAHYWIVDPDARILEAFELSAERWTLLGTYGDGASVRLAPFEDVELDVGRLFMPQTHQG